MTIAEELFRKHIEITNEINQKGIDQVAEVGAKLKNMIGDPQYMQKETEAAVMDHMDKMKEEQAMLKREEEQA